MKLEVIGDYYYAYRKKIEAGETDMPLHTKRMVEIYKWTDPKKHPWIARIVGLDSRYTFKREFLRGQKDYSRANSIGSRGVYLYYPLKAGVYEVNERLTWKKARRYFVRVVGSEFFEVGREEVLNWLESGTWA
jgi:hypothetical protein